jgi:thiamine monophosphate kinase
VPPGAGGIGEPALTAGDDHQLCFTVPPELAAQLERDLPPAQWNYRHIACGARRPARCSCATVL